jgi:hypothetical protein
MLVALTGRELKFDECKPGGLRENHLEIGNYHNICLR